jgi:hypothetical protein
MDILADDEGVDVDDGRELLEDRAVVDVDLETTQLPRIQAATTVHQNGVSLIVLDVVGGRGARCCPGAGTAQRPGERGATSART